MSNIDLVNIRTFDLNLLRALHALLEPAAIIELSVLQMLHRLGYRA